MFNFYRNGITGGAVIVMVLGLVSAFWAFCMLKWKWFHQTYLVYSSVEIWVLSLVPLVAVCFLSYLLIQLVPNRFPLLPFARFQPFYYESVDVHECW